MHLGRFLHFSHKVVPVTLNSFIVALQNPTFVYFDGVSTQVFPLYQGSGARAHFVSAFAKVTSEYPDLVPKRNLQL